MFPFASKRQGSHECSDSYLRTFNPKPSSKQFCPHPHTSTRDGVHPDATSSQPTPERPHIPSECLKHRLYAKVLISVHLQSQNCRTSCTELGGAGAQNCETYIAIQVSQAPCTRFMKDVIKTIGHFLVSVTIMIAPRSKGT